MSYHSKPTGLSPTQFYREFSLRVLEELDTPKSLAYWLSLSYDDPVALASLDINPLDYLEKDKIKFGRDYQAYHLLRKCEDGLFSSSLDQKKRRTEATMASFIAAEDSCRDLNNKIIKGLDPESKKLFSGMRRALKSILGRAPSLEKIVSLGDWGPGSSISLSKRDASPRAKSSFSRTVTIEAANALSKIDLPSYLEGPWTLVPGNLVTVVPKDFKKDRTIAIEPDLNSYVQKGIGSAIRYRLKKFGIDLDNQSRNQSFAQRAFAERFATIDLSMASDTVSLFLCRELLPRDWFELVTTFRSVRGSFSSRKDILGRNAEWFEYHKLSSMGNGFTFELESAIFLAVSLITTGDIDTSDICIYGDDIIVRSEYAERLVSNLSICGFSVNLEKSFTEGLFFESCGVHCFIGHDVTPFKIKELNVGQQSLVTLANLVREAAYRSCSRHGCDRRLLRPYRYLLSRLEKPDSLRGPRYLGCCLWSNREEYTLTYSRKKGSLLSPALVPIIDWDKIEEYPDTIRDYFYAGVGRITYANPAQVLPITNSDAHAITVKSVRYRRVLISVSNEYYTNDYGPWIRT